MEKTSKRMSAEKMVVIQYKLHDKHKKLSDQRERYVNKIAQIEVKMQELEESKYF